VNLKQGFPPGIGWIPPGVAIVAALVVAVFGLSPQFGNRVVGTIQQSSGQGVQGGIGPSAGPSASAGTVGHTVTVAGSGAGAGSAAAAAECAKGQNAGATAPGVTATEIHVASTVVTTGIGSAFLKDAEDGMRAAMNEVNRVGGVCGRRITLETTNDEWQRNVGAQYIDGYINSGKVFALVGEPDSEGLDAAITNGAIDRAGIPVVGTDGMLKSQYKDPWVWPVAASTVSNMHVVVDFALSHYQPKPTTFGIVYDGVYKFGAEGADAFKAEVQRETGGTGGMGRDCSHAFCALDVNSTSFSTQIAQFNSACHACDVVVLLLEPTPAETWMNEEYNNKNPWYTHLMGGEPLFDNNLANNCQGCAGEQGREPLTVWTGYHPTIQPFDAETPVYTYKQSLAAINPNDDSNNEFTEGAYLGMKMFIEACREVGPNLTRDALRQVLGPQGFALGLSGTTPLQYPGLPHIADYAMAAFQENVTGHSFNGWRYLDTGFIADPSRGQDIQ
jgi:ABC-type branched-subunit amino acid transport system substrate-binding protein